MPDDKNLPDPDDTAVTDLSAKKKALAAGQPKTGSTDPADYPEKLDEDVSGPKK
jgi:hypothetical protein